VIEPTPSGVRMRVRVQPRASRTEVAGPHGDVVRVRLTAAPVDGAANEALVRLLAERLEVPRSAVRILGGATSRSKVVEVDGIGAEMARARLLPP
jgi:uncharacterized protein (TIGR00251 family)